MALGEKASLADRRQRRRAPITSFNSATARPLARGLAAMRLSPNTVSAMSLGVSLLGLAWVASGTGLLLVAGALLVHVGIVLDHCDGQVARLAGRGSTWGMYLDAVIDRIVEAGLVLASLSAAWQQAAPPAQWGLPASWAPLDGLALAIAAAVVLALMMLWRFLNAYNDVLYLRQQLRATGSVPLAPDAPPGRGLVFNRDWVLLLWVVGTLLGQHQATLGLLGALHVVADAGKLRAFRRHHRNPGERAGQVLRDGYH